MDPTSPEQTSLSLSNCHAIPANARVYLGKQSENRVSQSDLQLQLALAFVTFHVCLHELLLDGGYTFLMFLHLWIVIVVLYCEVS